MKKLFVIFIVLYSINAFAYYNYTENIPNSCGIILDNKMYAEFEIASYTCSSGEFLPADTLGCRTCPTDYTCPGGTFEFNDNINQGLVRPNLYTHNMNNICATNMLHEMLAIFEPIQYTCSSGYYLPADETECAQCPSGNACVGGTYSFNETTDQGIVACSSGTFAPSGSAVCYPHILHVGDSNVYLKSTKQTTPSLNIRIGNNVFYANMTTVRTRMNKDSSHYLHVKTADNIHYYVCDDTICSQ